MNLHFDSKYDIGFLTLGSTSSMIAKWKLLGFPEIREVPYLALEQINTANKRYLEKLDTLLRDCARIILIVEGSYEISELDLRILRMMAEPYDVIITTLMSDQGADESSNEMKAMIESTMSRVWVTSRETWGNLWELVKQLIEMFDYSSCKYRPCYDEYTCDRLSFENVVMLDSFDGKARIEYVKAESLEELRQRIKNDISSMVDVSSALGIGVRLEIGENDSIEDIRELESTINMHTNCKRSWGWDISEKNNTVKKMFVIMGDGDIFV